ncbi:MAG: hypothetical protein J1G01_03710 [Clostridiales bacterium]|nr:hypothetical protein [Clostridiales bacterium]
MEIKRQLKNLDIKISRLAQGLGVSRPTLDSYIECYESGQHIPNERYRKIFEYLFAEDVQSTIEFAKRFDYVKRVFLQSDNTDTSISKEQTIRDNISNFAYEAEFGEGILEFINLLISNSNVDLVKAISDYFNFVNGFRQYNEDIESDKHKALFSKLFILFAEYNADKIGMDDNGYSGFVEKCDKIFRKKTSTSTSAELLEYLQRNLPEGSSIDMEYIKKLLDKKEN